MVAFSVVRKCNKCGRNVVEGNKCYCSHIIRASHLNK